MFESALRKEKKAKSTLTFQDGSKASVQGVPDDLSDEGFFDAFADRVAQLGGCQVQLPPVEINGIKGTFTGPLTGLNAVENIEDALGLDDEERAAARRAKMPAQIVNTPKAKPRRITDVSAEPAPANGRT